MISCLLPRFRRFGWRAVSRQLSCERGVSCCSWTSLSSTTVSAQSTPPLRRSAQLTQAHPLAHIRLCHCRILHTLTCVTHTSFSQGHIDANRPRCEVADDSRHRIESYYQSLRELHESRGRCGAQDASRDQAFARARVRACRVLARARLAMRFSGRACHRSRGPAFRGCRASHPAQATGASRQPQRAPVRLRSTCSTPVTWRVLCLVSGAQQVLSPRAPAPHERWDAGWRVRGQCTTVWGWSVRSLVCPLGSELRSSRCTACEELRFSPSGCEWHTFTPPVHVPDTSPIHIPQPIIPM